MRTTTERRALGPLVLHSLAALAGFAAVASWLQRFVPWPQDVQARMEAFEDLQGELDAVYLGTSNVLRSFRPETIDAVVSASGQPFRSFNLGLPGAAGFEVDALLRRVAAADSTRLSLVVLEAPMWRINFSDAERITERSIQWHTPEQTWRILQAIALSDLGRADKALATWSSLKQMALRATNYSLGPQWWEAVRRRGTAAFEEQKAYFVRNRGFEPLDDLEGGNLRGEQPFGDPAAYFEKLATLDRSNAREGIDPPNERRVPRVPPSYPRAALAGQRRFADSAGLGSVYVVPPAIVHRSWFGSLEAEGALPPVLNYRLPRRFPALYEVEHRFDHDHLNRAGATLFSEIFASDLVGRLGATGPVASDEQRAR